MREVHPLKSIGCFIKKPIAIRVLVQRTVTSQFQSGASEDLKLYYGVMISEPVCDLDKEWISLFEASRVHFDSSLM